VGEKRAGAARQRGRANTSGPPPRRATHVAGKETNSTGMREYSTIRVRPSHVEDNAATPRAADSAASNAMEWPIDIVSDTVYKHTTSGRTYRAKCITEQSIIPAVFPQSVCSRIPRRQQCAVRLHSRTIRTTPTRQAGHRTSRHAKTMVIRMPVEGRHQRIASTTT